MAIASPIDMCDCGRDKIAFSNGRVFCQFCSSEKARITNALRLREYPRLPQIDPDFGHWFAGLVDGEGCFTLRLATLGNKQYVQPGFHLGLRDDDEPILLEICSRLEINKPLKRERAYKGSHPQAEISISSWKLCRKLVDLFDSFPLRAKKKYDYDIWREAVLLRTEGSVYSEELHRRLLRYRDELVSGRKYKPSVGRVLEEGD